MGLTRNHHGVLDGGVFPGESVRVNGRTVAQGLYRQDAERIARENAGPGRTVEIYSPLPFKNGRPQGPPGATYVRKRF